MCDDMRWYVILCVCVTGLKRFQICVKCCILLQVFAASAGLGLQNAIPNALNALFKCLSQFDSKNWISYISYISYISSFWIRCRFMIRCLEESLSLQELRSDEALDLGSFALLALLHFTAHHELAHVVLSPPWRPQAQLAVSLVSCRHVSSVSSYPLLCGLKCFEKAESIWKHQKKVVWTDLTHLTHLTRFLERMLWESTRISRLEIDKIQEWLTMTVVLRSPVSGMSAVAFFSKPKSLRMWLARFGPRRRGLLSSVSPHDAKRSTQGPRWSKMVQEMQTKSITKSIKIQSKSNNEFLRSKTSCAKASETPFNVRTTTSNMFQSPGPKPGISSAPFFTKTKLITARSGPTMHPWHAARLGTTRHSQMHPEIFNVHNVHHVLWYTAKHYTWIQWIKHIRLCIELFVVFS